LWFVAVTLGVGGIVAYSVSRLRNGSVAERPVTDGRTQAGFVGDQVCKQCHADIYARYQQTGMARSWRPVDSIDRRPFDDGSVVRHEASGYSYEAAQSDGVCRVIEHRKPLPGSPNHELAHEVHYAVGSGTRAQAYAIATNGYLTLAPINWYNGQQRWDFNPGYAEYNHRFNRRVLAECVACHQGQTRCVPGNANRYEMPIAAGIGCETCHGPGQHHVAAQGIGNQSDSGEIVNPSRLDPARQNDVCFLCHLVADVRWSRTDPDRRPYRPGLRLADFRADFFVVPAEPDAVGVASHGARMAQSRCYTESDGRMTCISCHDPHVPARDVPHVFYDSRCQQCHTRNSCPAAASASEASCVGCHMPPTPAGNAPHVVFTEHWVRRRPAGRPSVVSMSTRPMRKPGRPVELFHLGSSEASAVDRGIALVAYFDQTPEYRRLEDLEFGMKLLTAGRRDKSSWSPTADFWLGIGYGHQGDWSRAARSFENVTDQTDDQTLLGSAYARLAQAHEHAGRPDRAVTVYRELIRRYPDALEAYEGIVPILVSQQKLDEAIALCQSALARNRQPALLALLAHSQIRQGHGPAEPLALLAEAQSLDPDMALVYLTRASLLASLGDAAAARQSHRDAYCAMARAAFAARDPGKAAEFVSQALQCEPGDAALLDWLARLKQGPLGTP
jgi:Tfp pilus assembly protein PilF